MITLGKRGDLAARRQALAYLMTSAAVDKLFDTIGPRFGDREGGYLRIVRTGWRKGDGADKAFVELLGSEKAAGREDARSAPKPAPSAPPKPRKPWKKRKRRRSATAPQNRSKTKAAKRRSRFWVAQRFQRCHQMHTYNKPSGTA